MKLIWRSISEEHVGKLDFYDWVRVGFTEDKLVEVRIALLFQGLVDAWKKAGIGAENIQTVECMVDLVVKRLKNGNFSVQIWGDYKLESRSAYTEEAVFCTEAYREMVLEAAKNICNSMLTKKEAEEVVPWIVKEVGGLPFEIGS